MFKLIGFLLFLLVGNTSFAQENQSTHSQCQTFVSSIFSKYGLPHPETNEFPTLGGFDLENYRQEKPEFTIMTTSIEIQKQSPSLFIQLPPIVKSEYHLQFKGKILKNGSYAFAVLEIDPSSLDREQNPYMQTLYSIANINTPLVHVFHFSKDCEFSTYHIRRQPGFNKKGFFVSANSQCVFDEPAGGQGLTAYILHGAVAEQNLLSTKEYMSLKHPNYYRGLCALAEKTKI